MLRSPDSRSRGAALVVVLSVLVLLTALAVAFFSSVSVEATSSKLASDSALAQGHAQSAVGIVTAQIRAATSGRADPANPASDIVAWASQPGMIRTWNSSGAPGSFYKLYSDSALIVPGAGFSAASVAPPANWDAPDNAGLFVDLNNPVVRDGDPHFPIVDPRASSGTLSESIEGFRYASSVNGVVQPPGTGTSANQRLPMPVRWLYLLEDGRIVPPASASGGRVRFATADAPSAANPIVARIAFWTDDETAKINVNTASEGIHSDIPRHYNSDEFKLAERPPVIGEFQRYPGHPATTALSAVFSPWLPLDTRPVEVSASSLTNLRKYYALAPRISDDPNDGSQGGTIKTSISSGGSLDPMVNPVRRLYASIDEILYAPGRTIQLTEIDRSVIERAKFFLTASSCAPDVNLAGRPRVTVWPVHDSNDANHRTAQDQLIAFCSTLPTTSARRYHFTRKDPTRPDVDFSGIPRNRQLYAYLQTETSRNVPGFGGRFDTKYSAAGRDQILTGVFDYIRSSNLNDPRLPYDGTYTHTLREPSGNPRWNPAGSDSKRSPGQVVPIAISAPTSTRGAGRFPVIEQASLMFYAFPQPTGTGDATETVVEATLLLSFHHPMLGFMRCFDRFQVTAEVVSDKPTSFECSPVAPASRTSADGRFRFFNDGTATQWANVDARQGQHGRNWGGHHSFTPMMRWKTIGAGNPEDRFTFVSATPVRIRGNPDLARWDLKGGTISVRILSEHGAALQSYTFVFPDVTNLAVPKSHFGNYQRPPDRSIDWAIGSGDIVRSLLLNDGDVRRLAMTVTVPSNAFVPHARYADGWTNHAHTLRMSHGYEWWGGFAAGSPGQLVPGLTFSSSDKRPFLRTGINGVTRGSDGGPGDWDNGFGDRPDGAYMNRADEGCAPDNSSNIPYFLYDGNPQNMNLTSPNRQIPSAAMFGSIPTGTQAGHSWQTLLFRPDFDRDSGAPTHPGARSPKDHLLLDLFHMPIVEPYAISEPLSTAGRVNLNYQILPFTYITRETGVRGVLKNERIPAIPDSYAKYKSYQNPGAPAGQWDSTAPEYSQTHRHPVNLNETLRSFTARFNSGDLFRSASEICDIPLVPEKSGLSLASLPSFWNTHRRTGDNTKERPYTTIYPRVTTQSNTFTVHVRTEALRKSPSTPADEWVEGRDQIVGEYRGSVTLERYVDPNDPNLPDFATDPSASLGSFYRFRTIANKKFTP